MSEEFATLRRKFEALEEEFEAALARRRKALRYALKERRPVFDAEAIAEHVKARKSVWASLADTYGRNLIAAPFIYALIIPIILLDGTASLYQAVGFRLWRVPQVVRRDYVAIDRHRLPYLNAIQKLNCVYCGYANGVLAYVSEIASRTEQYWCPIKHALRVKRSHGRYYDFLDYGDGADLMARIGEMREKLREEE